MSRRNWMGLYELNSTMPGTDTPFSGVTTHQLRTVHSKNEDNQIDTVRPHFTEDTFLQRVYGSTPEELLQLFLKSGYFCTDSVNM